MRKVAIIGSGNMGVALAKGMVASGKHQAKDITLTRRNTRALENLSREGFQVSSDNAKAVAEAEIVVLSILPQQLNGVLDAIAANIDPKKHLLISIVTGVTVADIQQRLGKEVQVVRAMPNTAIAIRESMTCIAGSKASEENQELVRDIFAAVGETVEIEEELMTSATALCACGIAFFLRSIRAATQGGTEIGFHAADALRMAAQTAKGAASLLLHFQSHPENEIDKVTSPKGCTIAGLNEMEHHGFSSALIKGIKTSSTKAEQLYQKDN
ncbi:pyrroline-5-carboxylate reductase [Pontibacter korlensis]|uniref:Pyrroline-5-carboxylate reductase n=1 Tax=Pontibacter korlensis TaxID=400092 RepID=A0A0E3ZIE8_9BACT|nr:pyrroline-5-carboxylate reductase [Pontibacter korlensis]AKD04614.1 pyrroline-5-carboxylate reductase [Pontibacter korlensis]